MAEASNCFFLKADTKLHLIWNQCCYTCDQSDAAKAVQLLVQLSCCDRLWLPSEILNRPPLSASAALVAIHSNRPPLWFSSVRRKLVQLLSLLAAVAVRRPNIRSRRGGSRAGPLVRLSQLQTKVPASLYMILAAYNLLPTMLIGFFVAIVHLTANALLFQTRKSVNNEVDISLIMADVGFYLTANVVGIFTNCLNETTLRWAFLDRRWCIESTIKLDYEKSQEEQLMLSILPKHIAHDTVTRRDDPEVSVLYADIVNFTLLTAALSASSLISMLNEFFGKFNEAAKEIDCLRIKILGDCYCCVSRIPDSTTTHAKNFVGMGFKMIEIYRQIREDRQVDVDIRIGIHSSSEQRYQWSAFASGSLISGPVT
ncbi:adenylate cyclase type 2-like [Daphnia pulicaria]|uniref:adenylate cyclase type 2-like n=1 Tax=Daphnia pulicaria TaxID=35523 RepID=UPI001EEA8BDD|nr:adenylate cyclase type 2-like [Daphnia pulicaria]